MANVSDWSANEKDNLFLDELNLSDQHGRRTAKIMAAVKAKDDEQDAKLEAVAGGLVFRGTKATYADLEAVEDPAVGDMYSVTALGGENYAWDGEAWDALGSSDANIVHKTGDESIGGKKTFTNNPQIANDYPILEIKTTKEGGEVKDIRFLAETDVTLGCLRVSKLGTLTLGAKVQGSENGWVDGANFVLQNDGVFYCRASNGGDTKKDFVGKADGTLTWNGQAIQTSSDARIKTALAVVPDAVLDAWGDVQWGQYQYLEAVAQKGESAARHHLGLIAQRVKAAFEARGLNACAYGILCHEVRDASESGPAVDLWMVRYEEALAMEAAFQRRRADRLERRIEALEASVNGVN